MPLSTCSSQRQVLGSMAPVPMRRQTSPKVPSAYAAPLVRGRKPSTRSGLSESGCALHTGALPSST